MKKTASKVYPYLFLALILTVILILWGRGIQNPETAAKRLVNKKAGPQVVKKSIRADRHKKSRKRSNKKVLKEPVDEIVLADETETGASNLQAPTPTPTPPVAASRQPAALPLPQPEPTPVPPTPIAFVPQPKPTPIVSVPAPQPETTPVASLPQPKQTPAAPPAIASNMLLTTEQARSLQGLYPGISEGWTIELYEKVADEFYARYARWGGDKKPPPAAFQEFLTAIDEEKPKRGLSFPRSWLVIWSNGNFIQATQTERLDRTPLTEGLKKRSTRRSTSSRSAGLP